MRETESREEGVFGVEKMLQICLQLLPENEERPYYHWLPRHLDDDE